MMQGNSGEIDESLIVEFEIAIDNLLSNNKLGTYIIEDSDKQFALSFYDGLTDDIELDNYDLESRRCFLIELFKLLKAKKGKLVFFVILL